MNRDEALEAAKAVERGEAPSGEVILKVTGPNSLLTPGGDSFADLDLSHLPNRSERHDEDGQPYIAYFTREPSMTHFIWNGVLDDPVQVTHGESGEPIDDTFHLTGGGGPVSLAEFKRQCDTYLEREGE